MPNLMQRSGILVFRNAWTIFRSPGAGSRYEAQAALPTTSPQLSFFFLFAMSPWYHGPMTPGIQARRATHGPIFAQDKLYLH